MEELTVARGIQSALLKYARSRFGRDSAPVVPLAFCVVQLAQLLSRYPNGITETIIHSETQAAFDDYRQLLRFAHVAVVQQPMTASAFQLVMISKFEF